MVDVDESVGYPDCSWACGLRSIQRPFFCSNGILWDINGGIEGRSLLAFFLFSLGWLRRLERLGLSFGAMDGLG